MLAPVVLWALEKNNRKLTCELHELPQGTEIVLVEGRDSRRHEVCRAPGHWMARVQAWKQAALAKGWSLSYAEHPSHRDAGRLGRFGCTLRHLVNASCGPDA